MRWCTGLALGAVLVAAAGRADDPPPPAKKDAPPPKDAKKDPPADKKGPPAKPKPGPPAVKDEFQKLQGTWQVESWEESGKPVPDADKRTVFFGGNVFLVRQAGKTLLAGPAQLDPGKSPPAFNVAVKEGEGKDGVLLGIYQLTPYRPAAPDKGPTLTLCYDPAGGTRPAGFDPDPDAGYTVVKLTKPPPPADERLEIAGRYTSELVEATGKKVTTDAVVERRGDGYLVTYTQDGRVLFVGTALRKGDLLSMCWVSSGQAGVSVYKIEKGPKLVGEYTTLAGIGITGTEVLVPWRRVD